MCYELYLSTSSTEDLAKQNSEFVHFERPGHLDSGVADVLENPTTWFVGSKTGCSCTFRHSAEDDTEFQEPQEWCPEEDDAIRATAELYRVIAALVHAGHQVDCLDVWSGAEPVEIKTISMGFGAVPERAFRFFENYHFVFEP